MLLVKNFGTNDALEPTEKKGSYIMAKKKNGKANGHSNGKGEFAKKK